MKKLVYIFFFFSSLLWMGGAGKVLAQQNVPLNRAWTLGIEEKISFIKDSLSQENQSGKEPPICSCSVLFLLYETSCFKPYIIPIRNLEKDKSKSLLHRKLKNESLLIVRDSADKFHLAVDPLFNFEFGKDMADATNEKLYRNTRGFLIRGSIGDKFAFESSLYENQATYVQYIDDYIKSTNNLFPQASPYPYNVIPGQGRSKQFKVNGYDYAMASGYVSYSPIKMFNFQLGHGKHFVGDGYRSLLLSDNAFNYPYLRITTTYKNIQYTNLYTSFMNLTTGGVQTPPNVERLFQKKVGSFQMLSVNLFHRLQVGLFQGMIWEAADSSNREHVNFNTFDPIIGVNSLVYGLHNTNNVLLGSTLKFKITNSFSIYGQYMLDDVNSGDILGSRRNKNGYQIGFKYFNVFTIKNLHIQAEYNSVRPYSYAAGDSYQSYTHYNQSLGHTLGSNFKEVVGFVNYKWNDFFIQIKANYAVKGNDSLSYNFGGNVFKSDDAINTPQLNEIVTTQGLKTTTTYQDIHIGYLINPATNFNIVLGIINRTVKTEKLSNNTQYVYFGIRTSLANFYYDF